MAPTTRRSTRSSGSAPSRSPSKSPAKKSRKSSPAKGRVREDKCQPRIDESLNTSKPLVHGEEENKRILSLDGSDGEVLMQVQLKSGIKKGASYQILEDTPPPLSSLNTSSIEFSSPGTSSSFDFDDSQEGRGWSQDTYCSGSGGEKESPSKLGLLLSSPVISSTSSPVAIETEDTKLDEAHVLKIFDMNHVCGPCRGISRSERYFRALRYKVQPPPPVQVLEILNGHKHEKNYEIEWETCIWDQHDMRTRLHGRPNLD